MPKCPGIDLEQILKINFKIYSESKIALSIPISRKHDIRENIKRLAHYFHIFIVKKANYELNAFLYINVKIQPFRFAMVEKKFLKGNFISIFY